MKTNLKVGDTFEVLEVLNLGGFTRDDIKQGGWAIGLRSYYVGRTGKLRGYDMVANGSSPTLRSFYMSFTQQEVKPVGRLVVTKVK